jgi:tellurite resistance protein TehA-like permease
VPRTEDGLATRPATSPELPGGLLARAVATVYPGYFAWVMASGIVSVGAHLLGYGLLSAVVLGFTIAAFVVLVLAYATRALFFWAFFRQSLRAPAMLVARDLAVRGYSKTYEPALWSVVFPLGMYAAASFSLGRVGHFGFMVSIARVWAWAGVAAWAAVTVLMVVALAVALSQRDHERQPGTVA